MKSTVQPTGSPATHGVAVLQQVLAFARTAYGWDGVREAWNQYVNWRIREHDMSFESWHARPFLTWFACKWVPMHEKTIVRDARLQKRTPAQAFLRSATPEAATRRWIEAASRGSYSFFEVLDDAGPSRQLRDMLTDQQFLTAGEGTPGMSRTGDAVFGLHMQLEGSHYIEGCAPCLIPTALHGRIVELRDLLSGGDGRVTRRDLSEEWWSVHTVSFELTDRIMRAGRTISELRELPWHQNGLPKVGEQIDGLSDAELERVRSDDLGMDLTSIERQVLQSMPDATPAEEKSRAEFCEAWQDTVLPALGGISPREAMSDPAGRLIVDVLLFDLTWNNGRSTPRVEPSMYEELRARIWSDWQERSARSAG